MHFETLIDYLTASSIDGDLAILPVPVVADHLNITPAAVSGRMRRGALEEIRIGKNRYVSQRSLIAERDLLQQRADTVERALEDLIGRGERHTFYEPIMEMVGLSWRVPADRTEIGRILAVVSRRSRDRNGTMLSVVVHGKTAGQTMPSDSFFDLARQFEFEWKDDRKFVEKQTDRVLKT
ncbi:MAG: hypothetical protein WA957_09415 [Alteraurantiacibacter sp.]